MMDSGYSLADIRAATDNDNDNGMGGGGMWWILILFLLFGMGGNGFGGNRGECATKSDLCDGFNFNNLERNVQGIQNGLCDSTFALNNSINGVGTQVMESRFAAQQCCCETNRNIDALRYEGAKNTCDIINAVRCDGDATRALITQNTIQELRDQLQAAQLTLAQSSQTQVLVDQLRPCAKPAYLTCSPYQVNPSLFNNGGCGGCGCG